jgi:hypothetical protein
MKRKLFLTAAALAASSLVLMTGCDRNPLSAHRGTENYALVDSYENSDASSVAQDVSSASQSFDAANLSTASLAKTSSGSLSITWHPWSYKADGWWTRDGSITGTDSSWTLSLLGADSVKFSDASGAPVQFPLLATVSQGDARHHVSASLHGVDGAYIDAARDFTLTGSLTKTATDTVLTLNGSGAGSIDAANGAKTNYIQLSSSTTVQNVTFNRTSTGWSTAQSGTITIDHPFKTILITFNSGVATVQVTGKKAGASTITFQVTLTR